MARKQKMIKNGRQPKKRRRPTTETNKNGGRLNRKWKMTQKWNQMQKRNHNSIMEDDPICNLTKKSEWKKTINVR